MSQLASMVGGTQNLIALVLVLMACAIWVWPRIAGAVHQKVAGPGESTNDSVKNLKRFGEGIAWQEAGAKLAAKDMAAYLRRLASEMDPGSSVPTQPAQPASQPSAPSK